MKFLRHRLCRMDGFPCCWDISCGSTSAIQPTSRTRLCLLLFSLPCVFHQCLSLFLSMFGSFAKSEQAISSLYDALPTEAHLESTTLLLTCSSRCQPDSPVILWGNYLQAGMQLDELRRRGRTLIRTIDWLLCGGISLLVTHAGGQTWILLISGVGGRSILTALLCRHAPNTWCWFFTEPLLPTLLWYAMALLGFQIRPMVVSIQGAAHLEVADENTPLVSPVAPCELADFVALFFEIYAVTCKETGAVSAIQPFFSGTMHLDSCP
mmetsp:Transcript_73375/g.145498  ORF Transcript_73375/g.145498 Transcript_73375/m.145498 type:complete len:266 (-) Transcript_73375:372-1169(-)